MLLRRVILLAFAAISLPLASLRAEELKIGVILGLSGAAHVWGDYARKGLELAVSEANQSLPADRALKLIFEDSQSSATGAVRAFHKLAHQDKVRVIIGDVWAFVTMPLIPLAKRERILLISPTVMDQSVPQTNEYFFSMGHSFKSLEPAFERFFSLNTGIDTAGTIAFDDHWNTAYTQTFSGIATRLGVTIVKSAKTNSFAPEFRSEITSMRRLNAKMILTTWSPEVAMQRMLEQNYHVPYLTSSDAVEALLFRAPNKALLEGMYFVDWKPSKEFSDKFQARYGSLPLYEAHNAYETIRSILKACTQAVGKELHVAIKDVVYDGVSGTIDFRNTNFPNRSQAKLYQVSSGVAVER
jgi:branched-chain amino acid transport system substrate-binding protein